MGRELSAVQAMEGISGRESAHFDVASVAMVFLVIFGLVLSASLGVEALYERAARRERARKDSVITPASTASLRAQQRELLRSYEWIDEKAGIVGLPIERAMDIVAAGQGLPQKRDSK